MPDVYATIEQADEAVQRQIADVLELRAADPQQQAMLADYLDDLDLGTDARVLDVGCGTGAVTRALAARCPSGHVVGVDPSAILVERARELATDAANLSFEVGDGRALPFEDGAFDAVVCHTSLCHIPGPEQVLAGSRHSSVRPPGRSCGSGATATSRRTSRSTCSRSWIGARTRSSRPDASEPLLPRR